MIILKSNSEQKLSNYLNLNSLELATWGVGASFGSMLGVPAHISLSRPWQAWQGGRVLIKKRVCATYVHVCDQTLHRNVEMK